MELNGEIKYILMLCLYLASVQLQRSLWLTQGVKYVTHYSNDFAVIGSPDCEICARDLVTLRAVCKDLGAPLAPEKQ